MAGHRAIILSFGYNASSLPITKYRGVKLSTTDDQTVVPIAASTDVMIGVAENSVLATDPVGKGVSVIVLGVAEMEVGTGGIVRGTDVMCDTAGRVITAATATNRVIGIALMTVAAGNRAAVLLHTQRVL